MMDRRKAASLRATAWNRAHPERRREIAGRYARKPEIVERHARASTRRRRAQRHAARMAGQAEVYRCKGCGAEWCPAPWARGLSGRGAFCTDACRQRRRYREQVLEAGSRVAAAGRAAAPGLPTIGSLFVQPPPRVVMPEPPPAPAELEPMGEEPELPGDRLGTGRRLSKSDAAVRLAELRGEVDARALRDEMELSRDAANQLLTRLARSGRLVRVSTGVYTLPEAT